MARNCWFKPCLRNYAKIHVIIRECSAADASGLTKDLAFKTKPAGTMRRLDGPDLFILTSV